MDSQKDIEIQVMACVGAILPAVKISPLNKLLGLGCEKIHSINGVFLSGEKGNVKSVVNRLKEK